MKAGLKTAENAGVTGCRNFHGAAKAGKKTAEKAARAGNEAFAKGYAQYFEVPREQLEQVFPAAADRFGDFAELSKSNVEPWVMAGTAAAKGWEALSAEAMDYNKKAWDESMKRTQALFDCTNVEEIVALQSKAAKDQLDAFIAEGSRFGELSIKAANEALEPIDARLCEAVEVLAKPFPA